MFSAAEEVIFALRTQGMKSEGYCCPGRMQSVHGLPHPQEGFPAPVSNGGRPKKTSAQDDRALKRIAHSNRFNRPPASLTCGTRQWHHLFQGQQLTGGCGSMVFQARYPALSLSYPANTRKNVYSLHRSIPSGRWRTGSKSSSLMNRNLSWVMATGTSCLAAKVRKAQGGLSEALCLASGLHYGLGMRAIPRSWKFVLLVSQDDSQHGGVHWSARCLPASICR